MIFLKHLPAEEKASWQTTSHFVKKTSRYDNQETHCVDCLAYSIKQHCDVVVESCLYGGGGEALTHTDIELSGCGLGEACKVRDKTKIIQYQEPSALTSTEDKTVRRPATETVSTHVKDRYLCGQLRNTVIQMQFASARLILFNMEH
ncbi:putative NADH-quinone oxidoreductase subunit I [Trichinella spiralis]|uniref:putative NADH-quinone oxidoreductase subunit I n=1 Tax=Trichinella spiralis TaxID=6334 RepID=UPI0001EFB95A|nr:putative NADH-quinone oxidoreductase subunit I [Trichinella spiralis]